jgi:hypothetical protein
MKKRIAFPIWLITVLNYFFFSRFVLLFFLVAYIANIICLVKTARSSSLLDWCSLYACQCLHMGYMYYLINRPVDGFYNDSEIMLIIVFFIYIILFLISVCVHLFVKKEPRIEMPKKIDTFVEGGMP